MFYLRQEKSRYICGYKYTYICQANGKALQLAKLVTHCKEMNARCTNLILT